MVANQHADRMAHGMWFLKTAIRSMSIRFRRGWIDDIACNRVWKRRKFCLGALIEEEHTEVDISSSSIVGLQRYLLHNQS